MKHAFKTIGSIAAMSAIMIMAASCAKDTLSEETQEMYYAKGELRHISVSTVMPSATSFLILSIYTFMRRTRAE